ncbi:MAG: T9SS type A sorting domain-containing protein [Ferruginibacter sp.]
MKSFLVGMILSVISLSSFAQTFNLGIVGNPAFGCTAACNPSVCSPTATGGQPIYETVSSTPVIIPANSSVRVQINTVVCAPVTAGPGLDLGDSIRINGATLAAPQIANVNINIDTCFTTGAIASNVIISLVANRRDETIRVILTINGTSPNACTALPQPIKINLSSFAAQKRTGGDVLIHWTTESEINNDYMAVERSLDGIRFVEVGRVAGSGFSSTKKNYALVDNQVVHQKTFYRLRSVDKDDQSTYSRVVMVNGNLQTAQFVLFPNPANDVITVSAALSIEEIVITDIKGNVVQRKLFNNDQTAQINIDALASGIYFVKVISKGNTYVEKLVKLK